MSTNFKELRQRASELGAAVAASELELKLTGPADSPLAGEWADSFSGAALMRALDAASLEDEAQQELMGSFEEGYSSHWAAAMTA